MSDQQWFPSWVWRVLMVLGLPFWAVAQIGRLLRKAWDR